jgi:hypothetical protein
VCSLSQVLWQLLKTLFDLQPSPPSSADLTVRKCLPAISLMESPLLAGRLMREVLERICCEGDVVTSATMALVLGKGLMIQMGVEARQILDWLDSLYCLLMRHRLYNKLALLLAECAKDVDEDEETDPFYQMAQRNQRNTSVRVRFGVFDLEAGGGGGGRAATKYLLSGPDGGGGGGGGGRGEAVPRMGSAGGRGGGAGSGKGGSGKKVTYSCGQCGVVTKGERWFCETCSGSAIKCSVCRISVRGALAWCQGCGHGGHLAHLQSWFSRYSQCPTGCGHKCVFSTD